MFDYAFQSFYQIKIGEVLLLFSIPSRFLSSFKTLDSKIRFWPEQISYGIYFRGNFLIWNEYYFHLHFIYRDPYWHHEISVSGSCYQKRSENIFCNSSSMTSWEILLQFPLTCWFWIFLNHIVWSNCNIDLSLNPVIFLSWSRKYSVHINLSSGAAVIYLFQLIQHTYLREYHLINALFYPDFPIFE